MNPEDAKNILRAARPGGRDRDIEEVRDALEACKDNAELAKWHEREEAFDAAFAAKLKEVKAPEGLKEKLLASDPATASESAGEGASAENAVPFGREASGTKDTPGASIWTRGLPLAASIALILGLAFLLYEPAGADDGGQGPVVLAEEDISPVLAELFDGMVSDARMMDRGERTFDYDYTNQERGSFQLVSNDLQRHKVNGHTTPKPSIEHIPENLHEERVLGCKAFIWNGKAVGSLCMGQPGQASHLYWAARERLGDGIDLSRPVLSQHEEYAVAVWGDREQFYVLIVKGSVDRLKDIFAASSI